MLRFTNEYRLILYGLIIVVVVLRRPEGVVDAHTAGAGVELFGIHAQVGRPSPIRPPTNDRVALPSSLLRQPEATAIKVAAQ